MKKMYYLLFAFIPMALMLCQCGDKEKEEGEAENKLLETPHLGINELRGPVKYVEWLWAIAKKDGDNIVPEGDFRQASSYYGDYARGEYALLFDKDGICYSPLNPVLFSGEFVYESGKKYSDYTEPGRYKDGTEVDSLGRIIYQSKYGLYAKNTWDGNKLVKVELKRGNNTNYTNFDDSELSSVPVITETFEYDKDGIMTALHRDGSDVKYYNHKKDSLGNWIERVCESKYGVMIERRNIVYYPEKKD